MTPHLVPHSTVCVAGLRGIPEVMGGVEAHCEALYPRLAARMGARHNFVVLARAPYVPNVTASYGSVTVVPVWSARSQYFEAIAHTALSVFYSRFAFKAKLIHIHAIGPGLLAPLAKALGMRVILTHHGEDYRRQKWNGLAKTVLRLGEYIGVRSADRIIVVSRSVAERLKRRFPGRADDILFIPNGTHAATPAAVKPQTSVMNRYGLSARGYVLAVGRLVPEKGFHDLIAAFRQSGIPGKLVIAGDVEYANAYAAKLRGGADLHVVFTGRLGRTELNELYANASLFVLPSYHEGLPIAALEALAQGAPVLLSDIQPNRDIALPNANYFRTGDVDDLAAALHRPHASLRVDGAKLLRTYNWDRIAEDTEEVITSLADAAPSERPPRLLFVINSLEGGGAERVMASLVAGIGRELPAAEITLALLDNRPERYAVPDSIHVVKLDCNGSVATSGLRLARFARAYRPEVIVSFLTRANIAAVLAARAAGAHCIISERVHTSSHFGSGISAHVYKAVVRRLYRHADTVVSVSDGVARDLADSFGIPSDRLVTINNPVDGPAIERAAEDTPTLDLPDDFALAVGRLVPNKNFAMLIRAYAHADIRPHLVILGEGPERHQLEALARMLSVADRVHLPGYVDNPHAVMRRATLYVSASNAEGFPNAMIEAMVLGQPVVATDCHSGPSEILARQPEGRVTAMTRAENGILVPPDAKDEMVLGLREMMQRETRGYYSARARERAATFDARSAIQRYATIIAAARMSSSR
jgi:glycosyltransferase involved in cell wall biosynthesis